MAQIYSWDRAGFQNTYWMYYYRLRGCGASHARSCKCNDDYVTYGRKFFPTNALFAERAEKVIAKLDLQKNSNVLVVGCAFGYLMEELQRLGMNAFGIDNSTFIRSQKNLEKVKFEIPNIDILSNNIKTEVISAFGVNQFDCIITEDVLPSHDSYYKIFSNCEQLLKTNTNKKNVVHIVQTNAPAPLISKTYAEWKNIDQNYTWLNQNGDEG